MLQYLCLSRAAPRRLTSVLARVGSGELGAHASPAAAELISDAKSVDEILRAIHDAASTRAIRPGKRQRYLMHDTSTLKNPPEFDGSATLPDPCGQVCTSTHSAGD
jgi:hypothetical protein